MIGQVSTASLVALVGAVLYLPSVYPPERFTYQVHVELGLTTDVWSRARTTHTLSRMLDWQATVRTLMPVPLGSTAHGSVPAATLPARRLAEMNDRLLGSSYFHSVDALLTLMLWRISLLAEWLAVLYPFTLVALLDGVLSRIVKAKELLHHDPETYALCIYAITTSLSVTLLAFTFPITLPPLTVSIPLMMVSVFLNRLLANFHYHG